MEAQIPASLLEQDEPMIGQDEPMIGQDEPMIGSPSINIDEAIKGLEHMEVMDDDNIEDLGNGCFFDKDSSEIFYRGPNDSVDYNEPEYNLLDPKHFVKWLKFKEEAAEDNVGNSGRQSPSETSFEEGGYWVKYGEGDSAFFLIKFAIPSEVEPSENTYLNITIPAKTVRQEIELLNYYDAAYDETDIDDFIRNSKSFYTDAAKKMMNTMGNFVAACFILQTEIHREVFRGEYSYPILEMKAGERVETFTTNRPEICRIFYIANKIFLRVLHISGSYLREVSQEQLGKKALAHYLNLMNTECHESIGASKNEGIQYLVNYLNIMAALVLERIPDFFDPFIFEDIQYSNEDILSDETSDNEVLDEEDARALASALTGRVECFSHSKGESTLRTLPIDSAHVAKSLVLEMKLPDDMGGHPVKKARRE